MSVVKVGFSASIERSITLGSPSTGQKPVLFFNKIKNLRD
jgi:hypothetical protein